MTPKDKGDTMPTDSGERCLIMYANGMVVEAYPPVTIYENGQVLVLDVVSRTELSDELVVVELATNEEAR